MVKMDTKAIIILALVVEWGITIAYLGWNAYTEYMNNEILRARQEGIDLANQVITNQMYLSFQQAFGLVMLLRIIRMLT